MRSASLSKKLRLFTFSLPSLELTALKNLKELKITLRILTMLPVDFKNFSDQILPFKTLDTTVS